MSPLSIALYLHMHYTGIERNFPYTFIHLTCPEVFQERLRKLYSKLQPIATFAGEMKDVQVQDYWPVLDLSYSIRPVLIKSTPILSLNECRISLNLLIIRTVILEVHVMLKVNHFSG